MRMLKALAVLGLLVSARMVPAQAIDQPLHPVDEHCLTLMTATEEPSPDQAMARITTPADGATIYGRTVTVEIQPENFDLTDGGHWHVWVDGVLQGMIYEPAALLDLNPGLHQICALLGDAEHFDVGVPDGITVLVLEAGNGTPVLNAAPPQRVVAPPIREEGSLSLSTVIMMVLVGLAAAVGGWWLGRRLPK